jgi:hypothetical protein
MTNDWIKTSRRKPAMTKTLGGPDDTWHHSDCVLAKYDAKLHHGNGCEAAYRILRYEHHPHSTGGRWYCPLLEEVVMDPYQWKPFV